MVKEGEGGLLLKQIKEISQDLLKGLMEVDDKLIKLKDTIKREDEIDKDILMDRIDDIRVEIGSMEKQDVHEIEEEKILQNMIRKLNSLVDDVL